MRPPRRAAAILAVALAPLGSVLGHALGYGAAGDGTGLGAGHAHLRPGAWVAGVVAAAALAWVATSRRPAAARPPLSWLLAGQAGAFVALEAAEHLAAGHPVGALPADPAFRWGLAAQAVAAGLVVLACALARTTGVRVRAALAARRRAPLGAAAPSSCPATPAAPCGRVVSPATERGPPLLALPA